MVRLLQIAIAALILGIQLPLMRPANAGVEKHACAEGPGGAVHPDSASYLKCIQQEEETDSSQYVWQEGIFPSLNPQVLIPEEYHKERPAQREVSSVKDLNKEEDASHNLSFNFLYYLFYKFSLNEFFKAAAYH